MSSTYSTNLRTELIGSGDQAGTWGNTTNGTLGSILEQAIAGVSGGPYIGGTYPAVNFPTDADITLTANNGSVDQSRSMVLVITSSGSLTATRNIIAPASASKVYIIKNSTTGGQSIQIKYSTGTGVTIGNAQTMIVYGDGTNFYNGETALTNLTVNGNLVVTGTTSLTTGSISGVMTAPTATAGTNTTQIATTAFVTQNAVLTGALLMWPTASAPSGYLLCNGSAVSRSTYSALFAVISTTFGIGDGSTTFNVPDYTNRMPYGTTIGTTGGSADAIVVSHTHTATSTVTDPGHFHSIGYAFGLLSSGGQGALEQIGTTNTDTKTTGITVATSNSTTGVSGTNANLPPYLGINFIIKT